MFKPTASAKFDMYFIGSIVEAFFYGLYSGIFAMYLQHQTSKKDTNQTQNIIFYSICALYVISTVVLVCDIALPTYQYLGKPGDSLLRIDLIQITSFACCDFIAQFILIYRCWIVWGHNIHVVIIPSILALAFLGTWLAGGASVYIALGTLLTPSWGGLVTLSALALSLTVNALVMGLIVFRIFMVFRAIKATSDDQFLGVTGGSKLRRMMFILIESGMALFAIQLIRLVDLVTIVGTEPAVGAFHIAVGVHEMLNGIIPTIILIRTSMGLSFHEEKSMEEVAIESLRFASNHPNSVPESGSIGIGVQDSGDDDIGI